MSQLIAFENAAGGLMEFTVTVAVLGAAILLLVAGVLSR